MAISNRSLKKLAASRNKTVADLAAEVMKHREDLARAHRVCAELVFPISREASSAIREYAQDVQCSFVCGSEDSSGA